MEQISQYLEMIFADVGVISAIKVTLLMAMSSTAISSILGIPIGFCLEAHQFSGKKLIVRINRTLMGVPPVVIGLVVYMLLMKRGPLGSLSLLFSMQGMILAQILIITPIISGMTYSFARQNAPAIRVFALTMGANRWQSIWLLLKEMKAELYFVIISGFGRAISEVGAVMLVGGNIKGKTRTMTTSISLLKSQGIFTEGIILGVTLLLIAFIIQWVGDCLHKEEMIDENL